jgi:uncharacterized DUF497 family protein
LLSYSKKKQVLRRISLIAGKEICYTAAECQFRSFPSGALRCASSTNRSSSGFVDSLIACFPQIDQLAKNAIKVYFLYMIDFEFDENKSLSNFEKHGIDFIEAQQLWKDPAYVEVATKHAFERRYVSIGKIEGKHWSAVITYRGSRIRIISVRRSRKKEMQLYES